MSQLSSFEFARQITLRDYEIFHAITPSEYMHDIFGKELAALRSSSTEPSAHSAAARSAAGVQQQQPPPKMNGMLANTNANTCNKPDASRFAELKRFERVTKDELFWCVTAIVLEKGLQNRVRIMKHFIDIAGTCS